jgi:hypothetical protein
MPTCRTIDVDLVAVPARDVVDRLSDNAWEVARLSCSYQWCSNAEMSLTRDVLTGPFLENRRIGSRTARAVVTTRGSVPPRCEKLVIAAGSSRATVNVRASGRRAHEQDPLGSRATPISIATVFPRLTRFPRQYWQSASGSDGALD